MSAISDKKDMQDRLILAVIGAVAGFALWFLGEQLKDQTLGLRTMLFLFSLTASFFGGMLAMVGPLSIRHAFQAAALMAGPATVLFTWASFRFETVEAFMQTGGPFLAFALLATFPMPFLIAGTLKKAGWTDYGALFFQSWNIVVRYAVAWIFVGLFWLVLLLCGALLNIVGLDFLEYIWDNEVIAFVLAGAAFGLAIAVVNEMADFISPFLVLRLLRLLLPLVLVMVAIFIVFVPLRGLSGLFGGLSAAGTLMAMALGAATLITTAIDREDQAAVRNPLMVKAAQGLALLLPVLAGLAFYAIVLRISQYGLTPERIAALVISLFVSAYAGLYAVAVLLRKNWMARIRTSNVYVALAVILVAALWLTPLVNSQRLSTNNQIARFEAGKTPADAMDLWVMANDWGVAGSNGIERLKNTEAHPKYADLAADIERLESANGKWEFRRKATQTDDLQRHAQIRTILEESFEGPLPEKLLQHVGSFQLETIVENCQRRLPSGDGGCFLLGIHQSPGAEGREFVLIHRDGADHLQSLSLAADGSKLLTLLVREPIGVIERLGGSALQDLHDGNFELEPVTTQALKIQGGQYIFWQ